MLYLILFFFVYGAWKLLESVMKENNIHVSTSGFINSNQSYNKGCYLGKNDNGR